MSRAPQDEATLKRRFTAFLPLLLVLAGVVVLLYPVVATQHNNAEEQRLAAMYSATITSAADNVIAEKKAAAQQYNDQLASEPILDPWLDERRPNTAEYQDYLGKLDLDPVMGRLSIPDIHVSLPMYHGTTSDVLAKGVGHLYGTSLPIGGASTHTVLTAHTGLGTATLFDHLIDLKVGDPFYINVLGESLKYVVTDTRIVEPYETDSLRKVAGKDLATLVTCTPYGINTHRLLVTGERAPIDPSVAARQETESLPTPMQGWMIVILWSVGFILVATVAVVAWNLIVIPLRSRRFHKEASGDADDSRQSSLDRAQ